MPGKVVLRITFNVGISNTNADLRKNNSKMYCRAKKWEVCVQTLVGVLM